MPIVGGGAQAGKNASWWFVSCPFTAQGSYRTLSIITIIATVHESPRSGPLINAFQQEATAR